MTLQVLAKPDSLALAGSSVLSFAGGHLTESQVQRSRRRHHLRGGGPGPGGPEPASLRHFGDESGVVQPRCRRDRGLGECPGLLRGGGRLKWRLWLRGRQVRGSPHGLACHVSAQGPFDMDDCVSKHSINPYGNRESRVLFSTWNLDHV